MLIIALAFGGKLYILGAKFCLKDCGDEERCASSDKTILLQIKQYMSFFVKSVIC